MEYVAVEARFAFFNGDKRYTVEFSYGLGKWFIFNEREKTNAVHVSDRVRISPKLVTSERAEQVLLDYLNQ